MKRRHNYGMSDSAPLYAFVIVLAGAAFIGGTIAAFVIYVVRTIL